MADKPKSLADVLAKELGYKSAKELKDKIQSGGGGLKGRLESGESISEAVKGGMSDVKEDIKRAASPKRFGKKVYMEMFKGDDIFSAYMRGRLNKKRKESVEEEGDSKGGDGVSGGDATTYLKIIAKNALSFHMMSRDLNVLRQNIVKLTKIEAKAYNKDKKKKDQVEAREGADRFFLKEDEREAKLEAERQKYAPKQVDKEGKEKKTEGGGILDTIMGFFKGGIFSSLKSLFSPGAILKILGKVFVIATIFISLFKGITAAFDKWKETGSLKDAIIAGLGAIVDFLSFGLFGEDSIKSLFDSVSEFLDPIISTISGVITTMKDWIVNNFGIPKISFGSIKNPITGTVYSLGSVGPYYPFKSNPRSEEPEVTKKEDKKKTEGQGAKTATAPASPPPAAPSAASGEAKTVEKVGGISLKLPNGVLYNSPGGNFNYKGITFNADNQKELDLKVGAIDKGSIIQYPGTDGSATITFNGATGQQSLAPPKEAGTATGANASATLNINATPASEPSAEGLGPSGGGSMSPTPAQSPSSGGGMAAGSVSIPGGSSGGGQLSAPASGGGGGASLASAPTEEGAPGPISGGGMQSGADLAAASQQVAEEQRMESAADVGSMINAPTTNNSQSASGNAPSKLPDVYDNTLALMLARA